MSDQNGKPAPDPALLTPNDWRRLRVALKGKAPETLLDTGQVEDMYQLLILAYRLREHPEFTWDEAGDVIPASVFDFTVAGQNPPDPPAPTSSGNGSSNVRAAASTSKRKPAGSGRGRSSASSTVSPPPNTTTSPLR